MSARYFPGFAHLEDMNELPLEQQYRLLRDLPDGRFIVPEVKLRMYRFGESASTALANVRRYIEPPVNPNALPRALWDLPSLIDYDHWANIHEALRQQGAKLPCDYMFGGSVSTSSSVGSDETVKAGATGDSRPAPEGSDEEQEPLLSRVNQEVDVVQRRGSSIAQVSFDICETVWAMIGRCLLRN